MTYENLPPRYKSQRLVDKAKQIERHQFQQQLKPITKPTIHNLYPGLNELTDSLASFPYELIRYFTLLKEIDAKCVTTTPYLHAYITRFLQMKKTHPKRELLLSKIRDLIKELMPCLEEKMHVATIANDVVAKHLTRINQNCDIIISNEIPESVRIGSLVHPSMKITESKSAQSQRSESRREALAAKKANKNDDEIDESAGSTPVPSNSIMVPSAQTKKKKEKKQEERPSTPNVGGTTATATTTSSSSTTTTTTTKKRKQVSNNNSTHTNSNGSSALQEEEDEKVIKKAKPKAKKEKKSADTSSNSGSNANNNGSGHPRSSTPQTAIQSSTSGSATSNSSTKSQSKHASSSLSSSSSSNGATAHYASTPNSNTSGTTTGGSAKHAANTTVESEPVYCYCQQVSYGEMVGCDGEHCLKEWFHLPCTGLKELPRGEWYCDECKSKMRRK